MKTLPIILLLGALVLASAFEVHAAARSGKPPQGAALLKTDILGVFAHPDDETGVAATLAYYALGRTSVVVNVYCTRGEGGGNMVGTQWGPALGALRETELRDCLAILGVRSAYFLDRLDWAYTESASATLQKWNKTETLESLVRLVRVLRPEVVITMNPAPNPGQHGHHQAAGILATEAFTAAADPTQFPLQLTREGLSVWQPRRLFYGGSVGAVISTVPTDQPLADGRIPGRIAASALVHHRSQGFGNFGGSPFTFRPQRFLLVKTFVPIAGVENDLLGGLPVEKAAEQPVAFAPVSETAPMELEFVPRPAYSTYRTWVKTQGIEHVSITSRADLPVVTGESNTFQLRIRNALSLPMKGTLRVEAPGGWQLPPERHDVEAPARSEKVVNWIVVPPTDAVSNVLVSATWTTDRGTQEMSATLHPLPRTSIPRVTVAPPLDGSERGWERSPVLRITPGQLVQGKVADDRDSSARVRLAHDGARIYVDVLVRDDLVITNIEPNDIRGHWRSDSVELCFDPTPGSEHTLGAFKVGIFPFDLTGVVRAARDADAHQGLIEETAPGMRVISRRTPDGYRIQASIPLAEIGLPRGQKRMGFNVIIYDGDKVDAAPGENINKSRIAWAPRSGVQGRPEDWGRIDLE